MRKGKGDRITASSSAVDSGASRRNLTLLLRAWTGGDAAAAERLLPLVYGELRRQAARFMRRERKEHTLRPTALVHEAFLRLAEQREAWVNREQFFAVAATLMRRILADHARRRLAAKRAGHWRRVTFDETAVADGPRGVDLLALDDALSELATVDPAKARLVELRYFGGLTAEDAGRAMGVSRATVIREWRMAKAWLFHKLGGVGPAPREEGPSEE